MEVSRSHRACRGGAVLLLLAVEACSGGPARAPSHQVEIINWWTEDSESDALKALMTVFQQQYPDQTVYNQFRFGSDEARKLIKMRLLGRQVYDTFQANGGWDLLTWVFYNNLDDADSRMQPINDLAAEWKDQIPSAVLKTVSVKDKIYGVPLNIHRLNTLFYNQKVFADNGVAPPTTLAELFSASAALKAKGVTPLAVATGDTFSLALLLFENLLVARTDGAFYRDFFLGLEDPMGPEMQQAVDDLWTLLSKYANPDRAQLTWDLAVDRVADGKAAMTIMGDWARGHLAIRTPPNPDVLEMATPGTDGIFVFTTDTFGLPIGADNPEGTRDLLKVAGSPAGQQAFNLVKGSISPRRDTPVGTFTPAAQGAAAAFLDAAPDEARLVPATALRARPDFMDKMNMTLLAFDNGDANTMGNASVVLYTIRNYYDLLMRSLW